MPPGLTTELCAKEVLLPTTQRAPRSKEKPTARLTATTGGVPQHGLLDFPSQPECFHHTLFKYFYLNISEVIMIKDTEFENNYFIHMFTDKGALFSCVYFTTPDA